MDNIELLIKTLRTCAADRCDECALLDSDPSLGCMESLMRNAADIIEAKAKEGPHDLPDQDRDEAAEP